MKLLVLTILLLTSIHCFAQGNGGRVGGDPISPPGLEVPNSGTGYGMKDYIPKDEILSVDEILQKFEAGGGTGGNPKPKTKDVAKRIDELKIKLNTETLINTVDYIKLANHIKDLDYLCAKESGMDPLTKSIVGLYPVVKKISITRLGAKMKGELSSQPPGICLLCDQKKAYFECIETRLDLKIYSAIHNKGFSSGNLTEEEKLNSYKMIYLSSDKKLEDIEKEFELMKGLLPGCFYDN